MQFRYTDFASVIVNGCLFAHPLIIRSKYGVALYAVV